MSRARRIARYLRRMFPPQKMVPAGVAGALAVHLGLQALAGVDPLQVPWRLWIAAASVVLFMLLLRVYDELKDAEGDLRLARSGDARFARRPLVTGEVRLGDLVLLRDAVIAALVLLNLPLGSPLPYAAFAAALILAWLSSRWFFWPAIADHLLLALVTHNPLSLVFSAYVAAVYAADFGAAGLNGWAAVLLVGLWLPVTAWELARKVRLPAEETDYSTYSKVLGWRLAALLPGAATAASAACLIAVALRLGLGPAYPLVLAAAAALVAGAGLRLRLAPAPGRAELGRWSELYALVATPGLVLALLIG